MVIIATSNNHCKEMADAPDTSLTGKPIAEYDKRAREEDLARELYGKRWDELAPEQHRYIGSIVGGEHAGTGGYTSTVHAPGLHGHTGAPTRRRGTVVSCSKEERENQVAQALYNKSYDQLGPEERLRVGSIVGGEHTAEGCYTDSIGTHGATEGMVSGAAAATGKPSAQPAGAAKYGTRAHGAAPGMAMGR
ncbi:hypothetical protein WJX72_003652 [[Myrmecia] bisecta]|uniref:Uncharacterized protein n=1 Tax=[Myrmecia] bisecta TaxID=41462 RepID=A0AAW1QPX8_9CHLO